VFLLVDSRPARSSSGKALEVRQLDNPKPAPSFVAAYDVDSYVLNEEPAAASPATGAGESEVDARGGGRPHYLAMPNDPTLPQALRRDSCADMDPRLRRRTTS